MIGLPTPLALGLIGYPLGHSLSPRLHAAALRAVGLEGEYRLFPVAPGPALMIELEKLLDEMRRGRIHGYNVTVPHKTAVLSLLDALTPAAAAIGAVNTISNRLGRLVGENTDAPGFLADLRRVFPELDAVADAPRRALVLGAGGAARAVCYALAATGWAVTVAARRTAQAEELCTSLSRNMMFRATSHPGAGPALDPDLPAVSEPPVVLNALEISRLSIPEPAGFHLVVNATSAGMAPQIDASPWPHKAPLPPGACVYDLVYAPAETRFVRLACSAGAPAANGLGMLVEQAALAFEAWTGLPVPRAALWDALNR